jgi:hypothetical protein
MMAGRGDLHLDVKSGSQFAPGISHITLLRIMGVDISALDVTDLKPLTTGTGQPFQQV